MKNKQIRDSQPKTSDIQMIAAEKWQDTENKRENTIKK